MDTKRGQVAGIYNSSHFHVRNLSVVHFTVPWEFSFTMRALGEVNPASCCRSFKKMDVVPAHDADHPSGDEDH